MTPDVDELPESVAEAAVHVSVPVSFAVAPGTVIF